MSQEQNIIDFRLSGGLSNTSLTSSFGGNCSQQGIVASNTVNNLFGHVGRTDMLAGDFQFRCIYAHVKSTTEGLPSAKFWLDKDTDSDENFFEWALETDTPTDNYRYSPYKFYDGATRDTTADAAPLDLVQFSISAWCRVNSTVDFTTTGVILIKENYGNNMNYFLGFDANEKITGGFGDGTTTRLAVSPLTYNDFQWHHFVVTYDQVNIKLYVDGNTTPVATTATTATPITGTANLCIGGNANVADRFITADLDEVYVWNNDLTSSEVNGLYNGNIPQVANIVFEQHYGACEQNMRFFPYKNFNGSSDFTDGTDIDVTQFSLSCWFLTAVNFGGDAIIVGKGVRGSDTAGDNWNYVIMMNSSEQIVAGFEEGAGTDHLVTSPLSYNDNKWHQVTVTYDQVTVRLYIDGTMVGTHTTGTTPEQNSRILCIGVDSVHAFANAFNGYIDEVYLWNNDLTREEAESFYYNGHLTIPQTGAIVYEQHFGDHNGGRIAQTIDDRFTSPTGLTWYGQDKRPDDPNFYVRDLRKTENGSNFTSSYPIWIKRDVEPNSSDSIDNKGKFILSGQLRRSNTPQSDDTDSNTDTPKDVENVTFGTVGDVDNNSRTDDVFSEMNTQGVMMPLLTGDLAYDGDEAGIEKRIKKYWTIGSGEKMAMVVIGNHDSLSGYAGDFKLTKEGNFYHIHEGVAVIGMNSETSFSTSSNQYDFVLKSLKAADQDSNVDWIIIMIHRPFITANSTHSANEGGKADIYMPLFSKYHVDLILQSHNHNYQRSKLLKDNSSDHENPTIVETNSPYTKGRGFIVTTCGLGGHDKPSGFYTLTSSKSYNAVALDDGDSQLENGFLQLAFTGTNNAVLTGKLYGISGDVIDTFVIQ